MKKALNLALRLFLICAVASAILAFTNSQTAPLIAERKAQEFIDAFGEVYPGADEYVPLDDQSLLNDQITQIIEVKTGGETVGYIIEAIGTGGYAGPVKFMVGVQNDGEVKGFKITESAESPGFGKKAEDPPYAASVVGTMFNAPVIANGDGTGEHEVMAISGATYTTNALVNGFDAVIQKMSELSDDIGPVDPNAKPEPTVAPPTEVSDSDLLLAVPGADAVVAKDDAMTNDIVRKVYDAQSGGSSIGTIYQVEPKGFGGTFVDVIGLDADGKILGFHVVEHNETEGYGAAMADPSFAEGLVGKNINDKIDGISGATLTSNGLESAYEAIREVMGKTGEAAPADASSEEAAAPVAVEDLSSDVLNAVYPGVDAIARVADDALPANVLTGSVKAVYEAKKGEETAGYVFQVVTPKGFADVISLALGVDKAGVIQGIDILSQSETEGYGAALAGDDYKTSVVGKEVNGTIDGISGATLTSNALKTGYADVSSSLEALNAGGEN